MGDKNSRTSLLRELLKIYREIIGAERQAASVGLAEITASSFKRVGFFTDGHIAVDSVFV